MIGVLYSYNNIIAGELVYSALQRSVTKSQLEYISISAIEKYNCIFVINPDFFIGNQILEWLCQNKRKLIILGSLPQNLIKAFELSDGFWPNSSEKWDCSQPAIRGSFAESSGCITYTKISELLGVQSWSRPFERFDFSNEWNNLRYGAIRFYDPIWGLSIPVKADESSELATIAANEKILASYAALFQYQGSEILWYNRPVGPIDSFEWRLVEKFISDWKWEIGAPCYPIVSEIPYGYDAAITMRLDCDEDVVSASSLWNLYQELRVPLSLAIHTGNLPNKIHESFLRKFTSEGGALLSHSATHSPYWGGSYTQAYSEAVESRKAIFNATGVLVNYAVSPFHQTPLFALSALSDAGYRGCIGGIISSDPYMNMARGGMLPKLPPSFTCHSQQTMLHGDCMLSNGDPIVIYKLSFLQAFEIKSLFGYLDHPFSSRYQYGWRDEESRVHVHREFIKFIRNTALNPLFLDECQAMEFLCVRSKIIFLTLGMTDEIQVYFPKEENLYDIALEYQGKTIRLENGMSLK